MKVIKVMWGFYIRFHETITVGHQENEISNFQVALTMVSKIPDFETVTGILLYHFGTGT